MTQSLLSFVQPEHPSGLGIEHHLFGVQLLLFQTELLLFPCYRVRFNRLQDSHHSIDLHKFATCLLLHHQSLYHLLEQRQVRCTYSE